MNKINQLYQEYKQTRKLAKIVSLNVDSGLKSEDSMITWIIVPFRDPEKGKGFRSHQLREFLKYMHMYRPDLTKSQINILVVEQTEDGKKFNRGALLNAGFNIINSQFKGADLYVFHDVDLLPSPKIMPLYFTRHSYPIHIGKLWTDKYKAFTFFGGIVGFNKETYEKVNGFPNDFWGWGKEDDANYNRIVANDIPIIQPQTFEKEKLIQEMTHEQNTKINTKGKEGVLKDLINWKNNGINSLRFKTLKFRQDKKYKNVYRVRILIF